MISPGIAFFVALYLIMVRFYLQDERTHRQGHCHPHLWRHAGHCWVCDQCRLRLMAN